MSLGIKLLGRAQSRSVIGSGISLVPRGRPKCSCAPAARISGRHRPPYHNYSTAAAPDDEHGQTPEFSPGGAASRPVPTDPISDAAHATSTFMTSRSSAQLGAVGASPKVGKFVELAEISLKDRRDTSVRLGNKNPKAVETQVKVAKDSVLEPAVMQYPNKKETASSLSRHTRRKAQQLFIEELQAKHEINLPDWRFILNTLRSRTPEATWNTPSNSRALWISGEVADMLLHEVDKTLWDIALRTDCELVLRKSPASHIKGNDSSPATVVLYGSDGAIESAKAEILHSTAGITTSEPVVPLDNLQAQPLANIMKEDGSGLVWSSLRQFDRPSYRRNYTWRKKYEDVEEPATWTKQTLEKYFLAVTTAQLAPGRKTAYYGSGTKARAAVVSLLEKRLLDTEMTDALSTRAFTIALEYIARCGGSFRPKTRQLLQRMAEAGVPMNTSVFNILLSSNAKAADLKNFQILLHLMTTRGFLPNLGTWQAFLDLIADREVKQHIFRSMNDRGLLKSLKGRQTVAHHLAIYDLEQARGRWEGIGPFLESQNQRYGADWMTTRSVDAIMNELGRMGKLASCINFLDIVRQQPHGPQVTTGTLNILLNHAKSHRDADLALVALARFANTTLAYDDTTYNELFDLFFRRRYANALGIVWRLACMEGKTSYNMRHRVSKLYDRCPFLVSPNIPMPSLRLSEVGTRLPTAVRPASRYWAFPHLPTFHHPDMRPQLVKDDKEPAPLGAETEGAETKQNGALSLLPSSGTKIATMFRRRWPMPLWRPAQPLHALLAEAIRVDRILDAEARQSKQLAEKSSPDPGYLDLDPEIPTNVDRRSAPGIQVLLHRRRPSERPKKPRVAAANAKETQQNDTETIVETSPDDQPEFKASGDEVKPARVENVVDIRPIIFSRTYGVSRGELAEGTGPTGESREL